MDTNPDTAVSPVGPQDKADLLDRIDRGWANLMSLAETLTPEQMAITGPGGWSVQDNLAHVAEWEHVLLRYHLHDEPPWQVFGVDRAAFERLDEAGRNDILYKRNRARSADDVLAGLKRSHERVVEAVSAMSWEGLMQPRDPDNPERGPLLNWVVGNTYDHYAEHLQNIEALLTR